MLTDASRCICVLGKTVTAFLRTGADKGGKAPQNLCTYLHLHFRSGLRFLRCPQETTRFARVIEKQVSLNPNIICDYISGAGVTEGYTIVKRTQALFRKNKRDHVLSFITRTRPLTARRHNRPDVTPLPHHSSFRTASVPKNIWRPPASEVYPRRLGIL